MNGEKILATLVKLLEEQEKVKVKYVIKKGKEKK